MNSSTFFRTIVDQLPYFVKHPLDADISTVDVQFGTKALGRILFNQYRQQLGTMRKKDFDNYYAVQDKAVALLSAVTVLMNAKAEEIRFFSMTVATDRWRATQTSFSMMSPVSQRWFGTPAFCS